MLLDGEKMEEEDLKKFVKEKYSEIAESSESDCCSSSSCCGNDSENSTEESNYSKEDLEEVPEESVEGLGCGDPISRLDLEKGEKVLDLGSGLGIDVFLASMEVGPEGKAIGLDASQEMVQKARKIARENNYKNVEFKQGDIEKIPFEDENFDAIISNCVINLSTDKQQTYEEVYRILKPEGRILVSDIVSEGELPEDIKESPEAWASCIGGAIDKEKYLRIMEETGFENIEVVSQSPFYSREELETEILSLEVMAIK